MPLSLRDKTINRLIDRIVALYRADKFDSNSKAIVSAAARKYPREPYLLLAVAEYRQLATPLSPSYVTRSERGYRRVLKLDPKNARAWENLAAVLDISDRLTEAARAAQNALKHGDDPDAVAILARIRAQQGRNAESRRLAKSVQRSRSQWAKIVARQVLKGEWDPIE